MERPVEPPRPMMSPASTPLVGLDEPLGEVAVVGLQPVVVADDDQVAVAAHRLRDAHAAAEGGVDRVAHLERQIDPLVAASPAHAELAARIDRTLVGIVESRRGVHEGDDHRLGNVGLRHAAVREERFRIPVLLEDRAVLSHFAVADVFPGVVAEEYDVEASLPDERVSMTARSSVSKVEWISLRSMRRRMSATESAAISSGVRVSISGADVSSVYSSSSSGHAERHCSESMRAA